VKPTEKQPVPEHFARQARVVLVGTKYVLVVRWRKKSTIALQGRGSVGGLLQIATPWFANAKIKQTNNFRAIYLL